MSVKENVGLKNKFNVFHTNAFIFVYKFINSINNKWFHLIFNNRLSIVRLLSLVSYNYSMLSEKSQLYLNLYIMSSLYGEGCDLTLIHVYLPRWPNREVFLVKTLDQA